MLQTFFWDCPRVDSQEFQWWNTIRREIPALAKTGFTSLWLPPVHKAGNLGGLHGL
jgi:alpha-amylase